MTHDLTIEAEVAAIFADLRRVVAQALAEREAGLDVARREAADCRMEMVAMGHAIDGLRRRLLDFTGAPSVDEALTIVTAPVEWDALASYHGILILSGRLTDSMVEAGARAMSGAMTNRELWDSFSPLTQDYYLSLARRTLAAALTSEGP